MIQLHTASALYILNKDKGFVINNGNLNGDRPRWLKGDVTFRPLVPDPSLGIFTSSERREL